MTHPWLVIGFAEDSLQLAGEVLAVAAGLVATVQLVRDKAFYTEQIGFHADFDQQVSEDLRFVQLTPPGSACSFPAGSRSMSKC